MKRDLLGFFIVKNIEQIEAARLENAVQVSVKCPCCDRNVVVDLDKARHILEYNNSFVN